jgi:hypothetical protein
MLQAIRLSFAFGLLLAWSSSAAAAEITGNYIEARTCDVYTGPCFANAEFGLTGDQALMAWNVSSGKWAGVDLSGLSVVAAVKASNTIGDEFTSPYPAKAVLIVDERATPKQKAALVSFAQKMGGKLLESIARVETAPIELTVDCCKEKGCAKLVAGKYVSLETRCPNDNDHVCGNEWVYYQPLTPVHQDFIAAVTVEHEFKGQGLNSTWSSPNKRSAFIALFSR